MKSKQPYQTTPEPKANVHTCIIMFKYITQMLASKQYELTIHYPN